jgi:catechol 2,3-dioxygenase
MTAFYRDVLGFLDGLVVESFRMGDVGLDEEQNHVIAYNTWKGTDLPPAPPDALGLLYFTIVLPDAGELQRVVERVHAAGYPIEHSPEGLLVRDPSHISVVLTDRVSLSADPSTPNTATPAQDAVPSYPFADHPGYVQSTGE